MARERILVIDGDAQAGKGLRSKLCERGFDAVAAGGTDDALALVPSFAPGAVLLDATLPEAQEFTNRLVELGSDAAVVVTVARPHLDAAVAVLRAGADSFVLRPVELAQACLALERALERRQLRRERTRLREELRARTVLVGSTPALVAARELVARAGPTHAPALFMGEPGTGKTHLAQALHEASPRRDGPFVRVSCAGLSQSLLEAELFGHAAGAFAEESGGRSGRIQQAHGGTLFLQEIGRLPPALQPRLASVIQTGQLERSDGPPTRVDVRVVASSQEDLARLVEHGRFREDLYYRLAVVSAVVPPLRARRDDIPALAAYFVAEANAALGKEVRGLAPGALVALFSHEWPGNVRELAEAMRTAVSTARGPEVTVADLPPPVRAARDDAELAPFPVPGSTMEEIEREAILRAVDRCGGSTSRAAELLGVSVRKVQYRLKEYRGAGARARVGELRN